MNNKQRQRKRTARKIVNQLFVALCCIGLVTLVVISVLDIVKKRNKASEGTIDTTLLVNDTILNTNNDPIYESSEVQVQNEVVSMGECIKESTDSQLEDIADILPVIKQKYEGNEWAYLFELMNIAVVQDLGATTDIKTFSNKMRSMNELTKHKKVALQFHNIKRLTDIYICPVSIVGIIENTEGNTLYDYDNVVETVFTIYKQEDTFQWLPYNVKLGLVIDSNSVFY